MSKHLLYCKDLLNRTLTPRSLLFVVAQLVACLIVLTQVLSPAEAAGPLSVKPSNPRYFFDSKGNPVYLTGSYLNEYNSLSGSWDFASYLDFLQQQKQNFTRVWGWEQSPWIYDNTGQISFSTQPYQRTGPGLALDGGLKFDLTRFNQVYFDQLRSRVTQAAQRGIYVSVMLFEGFSTQKKLGRVNPSLGDPFQQANNINGINGDPNRNGGNEEFFSLAFPSLVSLQEAFARKVVDTLNDLDNVLYEVNGNGLPGSLSWQYHMIDYIKRYQKKPTNQHPVGISDFYTGATGEVVNSSADWIVIQETTSNPPPATTKKVLIMEETPPVSGGQVLSTSPISLVQLMPDSVVSSQKSSISNNVPSSNGVTSLSSAATSSTLTTTQSSSNQQSQVATPTISPNGGVYSGTVPVTLQTTTPGASIYYTTDGQSPSQSSKRYSGKFTLSESTLVKAKAFKNNLEPSSEASAWFANAATPVVGPSGLVAHWKFDEGSGTTAADSSGSGNTGTLINGPLWTAGRVGNALYFDGIDDNVTVLDSASLHLSSAFTLSAWVNPAATFTDYRAIVTKNPPYYLYASSIQWVCPAGSPLGGFSTDVLGINPVCQPSPLPINTWTHLTVTYNGSTLTLYRNGVAVANSNVSATLSPTTLNLQIGGSQFGEYFKGLIDEVRIYNRAVTASEIQATYQQESVATTQTVATPVISPNGGNYSGSVSVAMQTATSGASIYYTTNGSTPTQSSTLYSGPMTLANSTTLKAKAFKSGSNASAEANASFTMTQPFSFSLANSGNISVLAGSSVTNSISTTLVSGSAQAVTFLASGLPTGATASFSSTSCSPACSSTLTINTSGSTPAGSSTITVTASGGGLTKTTTFSLNVSLQTVATPTISPNGGSYLGSVSVTMQTAAPGASIYYTTNGSTPTQSSTLYTGAMTLTSNATVKAKAFKSGSNPSVEASASFTVAPSGLVAYWKFDEGSGTTAADSSGSGNTGTLINGPLWTAGRVGNALYFDGIDDNVTVLDSASLHLSSAFTLSAWVNPAATFTDYRAIVTKNPPYYLYASSIQWVCPAGSPLGGFSTDVLGINPVCQPSPLPINTWTHLTVTYNGSTLTLYRNGVAVANSNVSATLSPTTLNLQIGGSQFGEYFKGLIDEVRIYNRAVTASEIQATYQQESVATTQTVATPVISPNGGNYSGSVSVAMQTATSGASIYYTTNGSTPTQSSTLYSGPMTLANSTTLKAKAFKSGSNASAEANASFTVTQPFSFSLASSGNKSVVAGSSVTNSIAATLVSGSSQAVSFSVSGLPSDATGSFSSPSCSPACSTILNIVTSGSTPAGNFPITVTSTGAGMTRTTAFTLGVTLALTVATPTITPDITPTGLVAYWKFDEGSGTTATDSSGNGNTGTLINGPLWTAGKAGNALYFDGIDDNVTVLDSASLHLSSAFTLSAWVNPAATFTDYRAIVTKNPPYYLYASSAWVCPAGSPLGGFSTDVLGINPVCQPSPLPINTWTHLTVTYNGSTLTLYRNGVAVANSNVSATLSPTTLNLQIGGSQFGEYFKGLIDEVRIYKRALTATEIQATYQQESVETSQTVATPVISPSGGNYSGSVSVTMQTATSGASIYYTTNGSTPTQSSTLYSGPMTLANSATLKAKAFKGGSNASAEASASFTVAPSGLISGNGNAAARYVHNTSSTFSLSCSNGSTTYNPSGNSGRGACTGGSSLVYSSIPNAVAAMNAGDTLNIRGGTYNQDLVIGNSWISSSYATGTLIQGHLGETVILLPNGTSGVIRINGPEFITIKNIRADASNMGISESTISAGDGHIRFDGVHAYNCGRLTLAACKGVSLGADNEFINGEAHSNGITSLPFTFDGSQAPYGFYIGAPRVLIKNNRIYNNGAFGIHGYNGSGNFANNIIIENNEFFNNNLNYWFTPTQRRDSVSILLMSGSGGIVRNNLVRGGAPAADGIHTDQTNSIVEYNTVTGFTSSGRRALSSSGGTNIAIRNNIVSGNFSNILNLDGPTPTYTRNLCSTAGGTTNCDSSLTESSSATFVNPSSDFHLKAGSKAIGAATGACPATDFVGVTRPQNGTCDVGAYEFSSSSPLAP